METSNFLCKSSYFIIASILFIFPFASLSEPSDWRQAGITNPGTIEDRLKLIDHLFSKYKKKNYPSNVTVQFDASLLTVNIDGTPRPNTIETSVLIRQHWTDVRFEWDPSQFGGQQIISLPIDKVWKPDLRLLNSASPPKDESCAETNVLLSSDGDVLWSTPCQFSSWCNLTGHYYALRKCSLVFGSWAWDGATVDLQIYNNQSSIDFALFYEDSTELNVTGATIGRYETNFSSYTEMLPVIINLDIFFQRRSPDGLATNGGSNTVRLQSIGITKAITCVEGERPSDDGSCVEVASF